jgi:hypothetical protein
MPPPRLGLACERAVLLCPLPSAPATVRITRRQCREQSSEPIVRNYQGRQGAVRRATEPLTQLRSSAAHSLQRCSQCLPLEYGHFIAWPAANAVPDSLNSTGKSASSCLGNLGGVGGAARTLGLFEAAVLSGLLPSSPSPSPSPSGPTMKNSGVTLPFLRQARPRSDRSPLNRSICFSS